MRTGRGKTRNAGLEGRSGIRCARGRSGDDQGVATRPPPCRGGGPLPAVALTWPCPKHLLTSWSLSAFWVCFFRLLCAATRFFSRLRTFLSSSSGLWGKGHGQVGCCGPSLPLLCLLSSSSPGRGASPCPPLSRLRVLLHPRGKRGHASREY